MKNKPVLRLTLITVLLFMSRGMIGPISSVVWHSMGASYAVIGLMGTVSAIVMIFASPFWGKLSDRNGRRKRILQIGLCLLAITTGAVVLLPNNAYVWLFPLRALMSLAQAAYSTSSLALMGDWLEYRRHQNAEGNSAGRRMGLYRGLASLGFGTMAFISGSIADQLSQRVPFVFAAGFLLGAFLLSLNVDEAPLHDGAKHHEQITKNKSSAVRPLPIAPLLVAALLWALAFNAVYAVWANYMVDHLGYTATQMTRLWALASLSEFPLMIVAGWLSDSLGRLSMLTIGFVAWALVFAGYRWLPVMPWLLIIQLVRGFAFSAHTATAMTYATEVRAREERGKVSGLYDTAGAIGSIMGSSLGGWSAQVWGFPTLLTIGTGIFVTGAAYLGSTAAVNTKQRD